MDLLFSNSLLGQVRLGQNNLVRLSFQFCYISFVGQSLVRLGKVMLGQAGHFLWIFCKAILGLISYVQARLFITTFFGSFVGRQSLVGLVKLGQDKVRQVKLGQEGQVRFSKDRLNQVRLGKSRLGQVSLGQVSLGQVRLVQVRLVQVRLVQVRLGQVTKVMRCFVIQLFWISSRRAILGGNPNPKPKSGPHVSRSGSRRKLSFQQTREKPGRS